MKYYLFTYDAIKAFMADRRLQSIDFYEGKEFSRFIVGQSEIWSHMFIKIHSEKNGVIFHTNNVDRKQGLLFDLSTFKGFEEEKNDLKKISSIVLKALRYSVKYFENLYLSQNERYLKEQNITLVYPYPFIRDVEVPKVVIDCNNWKEATRKHYKFLIAYDYQRSERETVSYTNLSKAVAELHNIIIDSDKTVSAVSSDKIQYKVTDLTAPATLLNPAIGADAWNDYLTEPQKAFVYREINGSERLEGAAGSGKTLSMCLRILHLLKKAKTDGTPLNLIYFTHSNSTKEVILEILKDNCVNIDTFLENNQGRPMQSIKVCTLQEWCADHLGINDLNDDEFLDKDAGDSKMLQLMHIEEAWEKTYQSYFSIMKNDFSDAFKSLLEETPKAVLYEILQREFSEIIKGQAKGKIDTYIKLTRPQFATTLENESDRRYLFQVFKVYQETLDGLGQFDSDDIVITAIGQIDAPIWNRRRNSEGYDACFIDETHLFNLNEISVFHFINKPDKKNNIIFCIDKSQSVGDTYRADTQLVIDENGEEVQPHVEKFNTLFRCSPDVAAFACSILTSGAAMFKTLENPLIDFSSVTGENASFERMPQLFMCSSLNECIKKSIDWAQNYCNDNGCPRNHILIVATDDEVLDALKKYVDSIHKPYVILNGRMDQANIKKAVNDNRFVIGNIDFVGGLEFDAVLIVGADGKRVPPVGSASGRHIINFAWYNRLYVAVTRAKYSVSLFGESAAGISTLLKDAITEGTLLNEEE